MLHVNICFAAPKAPPRHVIQSDIMFSDSVCVIVPTFSKVVVVLRTGNSLEMKWASLH